MWLRPDRPHAPAARAIHDHELVPVAARPDLGQPPEVLVDGRWPLAEELRLDLRVAAHADNVGGVLRSHPSQPHAPALDHCKISSRIKASAAIGRAAVRPITRSRASGGSPKPSFPQRSTATLSALNRSPTRMSCLAKMLRRRRRAAPLLGKRLLPTVAERLLGLAHALDERPELLRLDAKLVVGAGEAVGQREVLSIRHAPSATATTGATMDPGSGPRARRQPVASRRETSARAFTASSGVGYFACTGAARSDRCPPPG